MITEHRNISLRPYNTFGIDVNAHLMLEYDNAGDLAEIFATRRPAKFLHIGGGSNLLFTRDYDGLLLHCTARGIETVREDGTSIDIRVEAGKVWDELVAECVAHGWTGAENLSLIPGEVGASAVQNIGAYGAEVKDLIVEVETFDTMTGQRRTIPVGECGYAYRESRFKHEKHLIVTHVTYRLSKTFKPDLSYGHLATLFQGKEDSLTPAALRDAVIAIRRDKLPDPAVTGNAGSFFMNPVVSEEKYRELAAAYPAMPSYKAPGGVKIPAGWLIEQCGWRGRSLGRAAVHSRQALVLVNLGGATADEITRLAQTIIDDVKERFGITLRAEVNFI